MRVPSWGCHLLYELSLSHLGEQAGGLQLTHGNVGESAGMEWHLTQMSTRIGHSEAVGPTASGLCNTTPPPAMSLSSLFQPRHCS